MPYLRRKERISRSRNKMRGFFAVLVLVLLALLFLPVSPFHITSDGYDTLSKPAVVASKRLRNSLDRIELTLLPKSDLIKRLEEAENGLSRLQTVATEKKLLERAELWPPEGVSAERLLARVVRHPDWPLGNSMIVTMENNATVPVESVEKLVFSSSQTVIGTTKGSGTVLRVELLSTPGREYETELLLEEDIIPLRITGTGNGTFSGSIDTDLRIPLDTPVILTNTEPYLIGFVRESNTNSADSRQDIIISMSVNPWSLRFVEIGENKI